MPRSRRLLCWQQPTAFLSFQLIFFSVENKRNFLLFWVTISFSGDLFANTVCQYANLTCQNEKCNSKNWRVETMCNGSFRKKKLKLFEQTIRIPCTANILIVCCFHSVPFQFTANDLACLQKLDCSIVSIFTIFWFWYKIVLNSFLFFVISFQVFFFSYQRKNNENGNDYLH